MASQSQIPVMGHYHCIECGALFESSIESIRDQRCSVCGNPPTGKILAGAKKNRVVAPVVRSSDVQPQFHSEQHGRLKRTKHDEKGNKKIWIMMGTWLVTMLLIILLVNFFNPKDDDAIIAIGVDAERQRVILEAEEKKRRVFVEAAVAPCEKAMTAFLNTPSAAGKAQYVYQGAKLSGVMNRYYRKNPIFSSTRGVIRIQRSEFLDVPGKKMIGTLCLNSLGEKFEAIFIYEDEEWKIDWLSLVRYDARPWSLFPLGIDGDEGDYRLYMRVRDADEGFQKEDMIVVFYKPGMYSKSEYSGLASMNVRVAIDSELGKRIQSMLESEEALEEDAYGLSIGNIDPPNYHRVSVKMRLHKEDGEEAKMELVEILANHWYGIDVEASQATSDTEDLKSGN